MLDPDSICFDCFWHNQCLHEEYLINSKYPEYVTFCTDEDGGLEFTDVNSLKEGINDCR